MPSKQTSGWIKLSRNLLDWEWFDSPNTLSVWIYLLLIANIEPTPYKGKVIARGSCHTSVPEISKYCGISEKAVRVALEHLKRAEQIAYQKSRNFSIVSILRYDDYQGEGQNKRQNKGQNKGQNLFNNKKPSKEGKKGIPLSEGNSQERQTESLSVEAEASAAENKERYLLFGKEISKYKFDTYMFYHPTAIEDGDIKIEREDISEC